MIVFTLDALADDSHRRHFIERPEEDGINEDYDRYVSPDHEVGRERREKMIFKHKVTGEIWQPDWRAYYEACEGDAPIYPVLNCMFQLDFTYEIWSDHCESSRDKIVGWLHKFMAKSEMPDIKLRPVGDDRPQEELFELWRHQFILSDPGKNIDMVFSSHGPTIDMFRKFNVFVFDCNQNL